MSVSAVSRFTVGFEYSKSELRFGFYRLYHVLLEKRCITLVSCYAQSYLWHNADEETF